VTLAELVEKARNFVKDTGSKVTDTELVDYASYALADYSFNFPRKLVASGELTATQSKPEDALPGPSIDLIEVDDEVFTFAEFGQFPTSGSFWYWRGETIYLTATPATSVYLHYRGAYLLPDDPITGDEVEDETDLGVPVQDEELLVIYMAAKFHQKVGTVAAKLDRFKERGERDDNPLVLMHDVLMRQYREKVMERKRRVSVKLW